MRVRSSIGRRLGVTVFVTSGVALLVACAAFLVYDTVMLRRSTVDEIGTLARVIGMNTADALAFHDPEAAGMTLRTLGAARETIATVVYDLRGRVFATYVSETGGRAPFEPPPPARRATHEFGAGYVDVFQPLLFEGERIGTIMVRWDTGALAARWRSGLVLVALLLGVVYGYSVWVAHRLRHRVAHPLTELAHGAQEIASGRLATRVPAGGLDEIGRLGDAFNAMAGGLRELVSRVRENITAVSDVADTLREDSSRMSAEAVRQEGAVEEASHSVDQLTESARDVAQNVSHLADRARETSASIVQMDSSVREVASHMDGLAGSLEGASAGARGMASNVGEIVAAMEGLEEATQETAGLLQQLADSVRSVEHNARASGDLSHQARDAASRGTDAVEESSEAMEEIRESFARIQASVRSLAEKSDAIGSVLQVIEDVVDETNLLALNAAIIASQAGEQGKAFTVVADEVKNLAERTSRSTKEITALIDSVQRESAAAVDAVEAGSETVEKGVERSGVAGSALRAITEKSDVTAQRVQEIVEATARQAHDIREVEAAMTRVRARVEQTNRSTHEQEKVGSEIAEVIQRIRELGERVKRSTSEQSRQSQIITGAVEDVAAGVSQIQHATRAQASESVTIQQALGVFREGAAESARRARAFDRMVSKLGERSRRLREASDKFET